MICPLVFAVCMVPLTKILQDIKAGHILGDVKINHLFFMDDLKVYGKDTEEIESLLSTNFRYGALLMTPIYFTLATT